jgi:hypothetical protein
MGFTSLFCGVQHAFDDPSTGHHSEWNGMERDGAFDSIRVARESGCGVVSFFTRRKEQRTKSRSRKYTLFNREIWAPLLTCGYPFQGCVQAVGKLRVSIAQICPRFPTQNKGSWIITMSSGIYEAFLFQWPQRQRQQAHSDCGVR